MYSEFRALLEKASGKQEHVVAANIDIRGFSAFCTAVESVDVALFLSNVYKKLIDRYFPDAPFIKPTGDGLLIVVPIAPYTDENFKKTAADTIETCLKALEAFGSVCEEDLTVYFKDRIPRRLGVGLSMGSVCRLVSNDKTIDYSGRALNLASRLMDMARPSGIVLDASLGTTIPDDLKELFSKDSVYVHGIAERERIEIYYTKNYTRIPLTYSKRLDTYKWKTVSYPPMKLEAIRTSETRLFTLPSKTIDPYEIALNVYIPKSIAKKLKASSYRFGSAYYKYEFTGGKPALRLNTALLTKFLERLTLKDNDKVTIEIRYPR